MSSAKDCCQAMRDASLGDIIDLEDLFHDGIVAFLEAFSKYDKNQSKVSTFMYWRLKGEFTKIKSRRFYQKKYEKSLNDFEGDNL